MTTKLYNLSFAYHLGCMNVLMTTIVYSLSKVNAKYVMKFCDVLLWCKDYVCWAVAKQKKIFFSFFFLFDLWNIGNAFAFVGSCVIASVIWLEKSSCDRKIYLFYSSTSIVIILRYIYTPNYGVFKGLCISLSLSICFSVSLSPRWLLLLLYI